MDLATLSGCGMLRYCPAVLGLWTVPQFLFSARRNSSEQQFQASNTLLIAELHYLFLFGFCSPDVYACVSRIIFRRTPCLSRHNLTSLSASAQIIIQRPQKVNTSRKKIIYSLRGYRPLWFT